jgi:hypothetical protein
MDPKVTFEGYLEQKDREQQVVRWRGRLKPRHPEEKGWGCEEEKKE